MGVKRLHCGMGLGREAEEGGWGKAFWGTEVFGGGMDDKRGGGWKYIQLSPIPSQKMVFCK